jgi:biopolymer transport protein ExbD
MAMGNKAIMVNMNMTPLIDVLLVLLIIFMIVAPAKPKGVEALVPQPTQQRQKVVSMLALWWSRSIREPS